MLGLIYGHLPTKEDRRSFAHSCWAVHSSPDVLHQITSLTLDLADLTPAEAAAAVAHFPAGAVLRKLGLCGAHPPTCLLPLLTEFNVATDARIKVRLQEVDSLVLEVRMGENRVTAAPGDDT